MKKAIVLIMLFVVTLACGSAPTPPSRSMSGQTQLPSQPAQANNTPSVVPTATPPPQPTATWTAEPTATSAPTESPTATPVVAPSASPTTVIPTMTESAFASTTGLITIVGITFDGTGNKEPDEYVEIRNDSGQSLQLKGWILEDKADHVFNFPDFTIQPDQICRIYTDEVHPDFCGFSFDFDDSAIWNNGGDCAYLKDQAGNMVTEYCY